jgi:hypothetical protein
VWAFGVLISEIFTFGEVPYKHLKTNVEVVNYVLAGNTLEPPESCPTHMASLMRLCMQQEPESRPTFAVFMKSYDYTDV